MIMLWYCYLTSLFLVLFCPTSAKVQCGNHYRATCDLCDKAISSNAEGYNTNPKEANHNDANMGCYGVCQEEGEQCVTKLIVCNQGDEPKSTECGKCSPPGYDSVVPLNCGSDDCTWHTRTMTCRNAWKEDGFNAALYLKYPDTYKELDKDDSNDEQWYFQRIEGVGPMPYSTAIKGRNGGGYISIQNLCDNCFEEQYNNQNITGLTLFSIWDGVGCDYEDEEKAKKCKPETKAMLVMKGSDGVTCARFGNEGTGIKCAFNMGDFEFDKPYYIVTHGKKVQPDRMEYSGYLYVPNLEKWVFLGRIQTGVAKDFRMYSNIVEQFAETEADVPRAAKFYAPYASVDGENFTQVRNVIYETTTDRNHERYSFEQKDGGIIVATGGGEDVIQNEPDPSFGSTKQFDEEKNIPQMLTDFKQLFKCFNEEPYDPPLYTDTEMISGEDYPKNIKDRDAVDALGFVTCALEFKVPSVDGGATPDGDGEGNGNGSGNLPAPTLIDVASIPLGNTTSDDEPSSLLFNSSDSEDDGDDDDDDEDEDKPEKAVGGPGGSGPGGGGPGGGEPGTSASVSQNDGEPEQRVVELPTSSETSSAQKALGQMKDATASKSSIQSSTGTSSSAPVSALARSAVIIALAASAALLLLNIG